MGLGTASMLLSVAIHLIVGTRLLLLARRSGALPELLIGGGLALVGLAKIVSVILGTAAWVNMLSLALTSMSHILFYLVWWYVFRRQTRWAVLLCAGAAAALIAAFGYQTHLGWQTTGSGWGTWYNYVRTQVASAGFAWGAFECLSYHRRLRRRIPLGLAKPSTALRFLLWGMSMMATLVIVASLNLRYDLGLLSAMSLQVIWIAMNLVSGACLWLSFLLPSALRNRIDRPAMEAAA